MIATWKSSRFPQDTVLSAIIKFGGCGPASWGALGHGAPHQRAADEKGLTLLPAAEGVGGIDAENLHLAGEEAQLLQRQAHGALVGMAFDVGVELGDGEALVQDVALKLHDVEAVGGEAAVRLIERRRQTRHADHGAE